MIRKKLGALTGSFLLCVVIAAGCGGADEEESGSPPGQTTSGTQAGTTGTTKPSGAGGSGPATTPTGSGMAGRAAMAGTTGTTGTMMTGTGTMKPGTMMTPTGGMSGAAGSAAGSSAASAGKAGSANAGSGGAAAMASAGAGGKSEAAAGAGGSAKPMGDGDTFIRGEDPPDSLSGAEPGPYKTERYSDGYRNGPAYADSTINYPTDAEPPFALVVVVPGFVSPQSSIASWGPFLASYGIVTMTIGTNLPTDLPETRKDALLDALQSLKEENSRSGSPLEGKLATDVTATMGWSMGGGGTLLVANETPELKATISLCGWNPGYPYSKIKAPALMFASLGDPLAGGQSQGFYRSIPDETPKMLIEIGAGDHFVANNPASTSGVVGRYGLAWLKVFLEGDERYRKFLKEMPKVPTTDFESNVK